MNNAQLVASVLIEPQAAFASLREKPRFWFPLLLLILGTAAALLGYFQMVDFNWFTDNVLHGGAGKAAKAGEDAPVMSRGAIMGMTLGATVIFLSLSRVLEGTYYLLAGRVADVGQSFAHWLALACWSSIPMLLTVLVSMGFLLMHPNGQVTQEELNVLSLNEVFFHVDRSSPWFALLSTLTVLHPWVWWLTATGVKVWSGRSLAFGVVFSMVPWAVFYGGWALIALLRG